MGGLAAVQPVGTEWHSHSPATTGCECVVKRLAVVPLVIVLLVPLVKISAMHDRENSLIITDRFLPERYNRAVRRARGPVVGFVWSSAHHFLVIGNRQP